MTGPSFRGSYFARVPVLVVFTILLLALAPLVLLTTESLWLRWVAIMALAWWLPGALLVAHWRLSDLDLPAAAVLAMGLGLCWMVSGALLVHWLPGPMELWHLIAVYEIGALSLAVLLLWHRPLPLQPTSASTWGWLAVLLLLTVLLRLPGLGYHEFHGDEVMVLHRAGRAIEGADGILARHAKGPGEIAVAMVAYLGTDTANEASARLPFALLGIGSVLATALLGRRLFSPTVGFWAGVLLAFNGFALGLSRIVQYQPAVLLLSVLAVLCAWEFSRRGEGRWLALATLLSGCAVLMHYEFALLAPVLLVLAWMGWRRAADKRRILVLALVVGLLVAVVVTATYLPGVLNPRFARTQRYLGSRLGDLGAFNVPIFVELGTFYNGTYFFIGLILLVVAGLILGWRRVRRRSLLLALWFLPFFILHLLVMQDPGTHFYLFMPSWSLLAALPLAAVTESRQIGRLLRWVLLGALAFWLLISAGYLYLTFFRQSPEYVVNYEQTHLPFYWAPYGKEVPQRPRYAVPIQQGWKALGTVAAWGCLEGTYTSNEGSQSLRSWYLSPLQRVEFEAVPNYIFVATHLQARYPEYHGNRLEGYRQVGEVRVRDESRIEIWARDALATSYLVLDSEEFRRTFDSAVPRLGDRPGPPGQVRDVTLGGMVTLESAGLERSTFARGDTLHLNQVWRPEQALANDYKLFVHLADKDGRPVAQWDGLPCLNLAHTSHWPVGQSIPDHVLMRIPDDMPTGEYSVLIGLYDGTTGERLGGQAVEIATIEVR